jgi:hypothetical protein
MPLMSDTASGSRDVIDISENAPVSRARIPHYVFNPVGCYLAKYVSNKGWSEASFSRQGPRNCHSACEERGKIFSSGVESKVGRWRRRINGKGRLDDSVGGGSPK